MSMQEARNGYTFSFFKRNLILKKKKQSTPTKRISHSNKRLKQPRASAAYRYK